MDNYTYKEYSDEESRIYNEAITKLLNLISNGVKFNDACDLINVEDEELKGFIIDDVIKIVIAELHYINKIPLKGISEFLDLPIEVILKANKEMLEDLSNSSIDFHRIDNPDIPYGNA